MGSPAGPLPVMDQNDPPIGRCPECWTAIPPTRVLIECEAGDGTPAMYAECPGCYDVVHPHPVESPPTDD